MTNTEFKKALESHIAIKMTFIDELEKEIKEVKEITDESDEYYTMLQANLTASKATLAKYVARYETLK